MRQVDKVTGCGDRSLLSRDRGRPLREKGEEGSMYNPCNVRQSPILREKTHSQDRAYKRTNQENPYTIFPGGEKRVWLE